MTTYPDMVLKTGESGFWPHEAQEGVLGIDEDFADSTNRPFGFALHVLDTLLQQRQLTAYMKTGGFAADAFMNSQLRDLLDEHGCPDITPEQVWALAFDVIFSDPDPLVPNDISELGESADLAVA